MTTFPPFDFPLTRPAALIVIDMQPSCVHRDVGLAKSMENTEPGYSRHLVERVETVVVPAIQKLIGAFHDARQPVFYTAFVSKTGDGSDIRTSTIRYRSEQRQARTGSSVMMPADDPAAGIIDELAPGAQDTVLQKTSMDAFLSTDLEARLQAAEIQSVVLCGVYGDACVASTARTAAELGFRVFVAEDACAAWEPAFLEQSLQGLARYFARVDAADRIVELLPEA
jgi:nicotinamidase-related amidase